MWKELKAVSLSKKKSQFCPWAPAQGKNISSQDLQFTFTGWSLTAKAGFARNPKDTFSHHREHRAHREKNTALRASLKVFRITAVSRSFPFSVLSVSSVVKDSRSLRLSFFLFLSWTSCLSCLKMEIPIRSRQHFRLSSLCYIVDQRKIWVSMIIFIIFSLCLCHKTFRWYRDLRPLYRLAL